MDLSEYEEIQKNKKLLEESRGELKSLYEENKKLQQEKIDVLKNAEKSVTIVKRNETTEVVHLKRPVEELVKAIEQIYRDTLYYQGDYSQPSYERIVNYFFEKSKVSNYLPAEEVTLKGLDEVKDELRQEVKKEFQDNIEKLEESVRYYKDIKNILDDKISEVLIKNKALKHELSEAESDIMKLTEETLEQEELLTCYDASMKSYNEIEEILNTKSFTIFNFRKLVNTLKSKLIL